MNNLFLINVLLALVWSAVTGSFTPLNIIFGFVLGSIALLLIREQVGTGGYIRRLYRIISLILLFLYELVMSALRVFLIVTKPKMTDLKPGIFAYPLKAKTDFEITLLANVITLTPGTLSVDVSDNRKTLYIHAIHVPDVEEAIQDIANGFERKIMEAFQ